MKKGILKYLTMVIMIWVLAIGLMFLFAAVGVLLWNYAVTAIFGLPEITYWQMVALLVLIRFFAPYQFNYKK